MNRNTLILLALLVLLGLAALYLLERPGEQSVLESGGPELLDVDSLAVDRIEVRTPSMSLIIEKQGSEWMLREPLRARADQSVLASLIHDMKGLRSMTVVSTNPGKQSVFQVDSTGTMVKLFEKGAEKTSFVIGKMGGGFSDVYLRIPPSNDVMLVDAPLFAVTTRQIKDWRDRNIITLPKEGIREVKFQYGDTTFVLSLKDSIWMIGNDQTQEWVVNGLIGSLASFQADEFVDIPPSPAPRFTAILSFANLQLRFAPQKGSDKFYVQGSSSPQWYEVQQWRANQVLKRKKDLVKPRS